jgi:NADPH:quinone reductase-like Zn-dependent oxidoreductase
VKSIEDGSLTVPLDRVVPLDRLETALAALENREVLGKIVLQIEGDDSHPMHAT